MCGLISLLHSLIFNLIIIKFVLNIDGHTLLHCSKDLASINHYLNYVEATQAKREEIHIFPYVTA